MACAAHAETARHRILRRRSRLGLRVLSSSTASFDRVKKLRGYADANVAHAWPVDPLAQTLEVLRLEDGRWVILATHAGDEVVRADPFSEIEIPLQTLWAEAAA